MKAAKKNILDAEVDGAADAFAIRAVRYLPRRDSIELAFASGATLTVPRGALHHFDGLPADAPRGLVVSPSADALISRSLDIEIGICGLVATVLGTRRLSAAFAQQGGRQTSRAKAAAARANGAKGGRPRNRRGR